MPVIPLLELVETTHATLPRVQEGDNAGLIGGAVVDGIKQIARGCDYPPSEIRGAIEAVRADLYSGDYDHVLDVARRYFRLDGDL